jgi:uncharacterized protein (DUF3084 family)
MVRPIQAFTSVAILLAAFCACDKQPGVTEQQKETKANEQAAAARNDAIQQMETAQAKADRERAEAQVTFEKIREDYRHMRRDDLADLDKKIVDLHADVRTATGKTKANLQQNLPSIQARRDAFVRHMQELDTTTPAAWDAAKANLDKEWIDLKAQVDKAK